MLFINFILTEYWSKPKQAGFHKLLTITNLTLMALHAC